MTYNFPVDPMHLNELGRQYHTAIHDKDLSDKQTKLEMLGNEIVLYSARWIYSIAIRLTTRGYRMPQGQVLKVNTKIDDLDELVSIGVIAVLDKMKNYDPEKGAVTTFIGPEVAHAMYRHSCYDKLVRVSVRNLETVIKAVSYAGDTDETRKEIAAELFTSESLKGSINYLFNAARDNYISLNASPRSAEGVELQEYIMKGDPMVVEDEVHRAEMTDLLNSVIEKRLTERERTILAERFGFYGKKPKTLEEVGKDLGVTRERVRQIEEKAKRKIKVALSKRITEDDLF
ncbi:hypothetical protein COV93_04175 [Candidatus Woesearchaeota archaeon CG11_big_fil_rev_8_21_14_0_20_43_8]|nr:MAG: hypothetical protein COV93_04175 [Candidatus Woesearchaeota archaeon CG11_big_fil_rev_8_21_14_0_20_43_8]PIO05706.1 MAG: hypothetical protein COT47_03645 [Candidatus Woesearchaeota archaeon CG08_land_8_20_14_0_20_43_7]